MPSIISRAQWGAQAPHSRTTFREPATSLFLHHTVTQQYLADIHGGARAVQQIAFARGFADISYSFLVFADGSICEGRGWGVVGAHTVGYNSTGHAFSLVGNYENDHPTEAQIDSVRWLTHIARLHGHNTPSEIRPHREVYSTACPGAHALARLNDFRKPWSGTPTPTPGGPFMALTDAEQAELLEKTRKIYSNTFNVAQWQDPVQGWQKARDDSLKNIREWTLRILAKVGA